ncbi:hypothetical protein ACLOJK_022746 [Asimina triloba]
MADAEVLDMVGLPNLCMVTDRHYEAARRMELLPFIAMKSGMGNTTSAGRSRILILYLPAVKADPIERLKLAASEFMSFLREKLLSPDKKKVSGVRRWWVQRQPCGDDSEMAWIVEMQSTSRDCCSPASCRTTMMTAIHGGDDGAP